MKMFLVMDLILLAAIATAESVQKFGKTKDSTFKRSRVARYTPSDTSYDSGYTPSPRYTPSDTSYDSGYTPSPRHTPSDTSYDSGYTPSPRYTPAETYYDTGVQKVLVPLSSLQNYESYIDPSLTYVQPTDAYILPAKYDTPYEVASEIPAPSTYSAYVQPQSFIAELDYGQTSNSAPVVDAYEYNNPVYSSGNPLHFTTLGESSANFKPDYAIEYVRPCSYSAPSYDTPSAYDAPGVGGYNAPAYSYIQPTYGDLQLENYGPATLAQAKDLKQSVVLDSVDLMLLGDAYSENQEYLRILTSRYPTIAVISEEPYSAY